MGNLTKVNTALANMDLYDPDARLVNTAAIAGRFVGRNAVRISRVTAVFLISAFDAAKEEIRRVRESHPESTPDDGSSY